jgi:4-hydroxy-3-methylbut-2-enyl diphosphate reductase IspH
MQLAVVLFTIALIPKIDVYDHQWRRPGECQSDALVDVRLHAEPEWKVVTCEQLVHNYTLAGTQYPCALFLRLVSPVDMALDVTHQAYGDLKATSDPALLRQAAIQICAACCPSVGQVRAAKTAS